LLASFLYEVGTADATSLLGATVVLMGAGLLAAFIPGVIRMSSTSDGAEVPGCTGHTRRFS
jgi:hypothetical protein